MDFNVKDKKNVLGIITFAILLFWGVQNYTRVLDIAGTIIGMLSPFLLGAAIAFVLNVPMKLFERILFKKKGNTRLSRSVSMLLAILFATGIVFFVLFMIIPELGRTAATLNAGIPAMVNNMNNWMNELLMNNPDLMTTIASLDLEWESLGKTALQFVQAGVTNVFSSTLGIASSVFSGLINFVIGFIFAIYILMQKETLTRQFKKLFYAYFKQYSADRMVEIGTLANKTFSNFITGQCTEAVIFGVLCFIGMSIFRFPYALTISVVVGFTALIPVFGAFIGTVLGFLLIVVVSPSQAVWFVVFILILQQIEGNLIYPRVVGGSVGLPAMWVIMAVTLGGSLMGLFGMLVFVPFSSVLYCLLREAVQKRVVLKKVPDTKWKE